MKWSRRHFLLGVSAVAATAGAAIPIAHFLKQPSESEPAPEPEEGVTPGEAVVEPATDENAMLANRLRGIWDITFTGADAELPGLPKEGAELVLDVGPTGRSLRGYIGLPGSLRGEGVPEYRVMGDLIGASPGKISWRVISNQPSAEGIQMPCHEFTGLWDELWLHWGVTDTGTLSGKVHRLNRSPRLPEIDFTFVAKKRVFPEARETAGLKEELLAWLISPEHRLFHQIWHAARDKWHEFPEEKRNALRTLGWQPGEIHKERDARGKKKHLNGSGEDFLFMHRDMVVKARKLQPDLISWPLLPQPAPYAEQDCPGFIRYFENHDGCSVPPGWEVAHDEEYTEWLLGVKGTDTFYSNYQVWESQYQNPEYLSQLTLGEFGSEMELGIHDWLHMRWATITRDPTSNLPDPWNRSEDDFSERWFLPENDYLGDPFSSHVHPVFWMFHGWIDDRIEDWFRAHERYHPGEVQRKVVKGVPWFEAGRWVEVADPWLGPSSYGCLPDAEKSSQLIDEDAFLNLDDMKLAISVAFSDEENEKEVLGRVPRRPWYARHMKLNKSV